MSFILRFIYILGLSMNILSQIGFPFINSSAETTSSFLLSGAMDSCFAVFSRSEFPLLESTLPASFRTLLSAAHTLSFISGLSLEGQSRNGLIKSFVVWISTVWSRAKEWDCVLPSNALTFPGLWRPRMRARDGQCSSLCCW